MPPTRRRSGGPNTSSSTTGAGNQSTLSFGGQSRISKPTTTTTHTGKKATITQLRQQRHRSTSGGSSPAPTSASASPAPVPAEIEPEERALPASSRSDEVVREQARVELRERDGVEGLAEGVSEGEIEGYWEREEAGRIAPRVHQEHLTRNEKILRHFDLSNQYGPCIGIARVKRWKRAHGLGLNPPIEVLAVLLKEETQGVANEKAYMDELLS
ncbi:hypothetical protein FQN50_002578 [Emmonsiellopsis sp. PD_5]|nr:hypothetical protein FQN50_002578 [Emmonsiellopsis sp. PD_5]